MHNLKLYNKKCENVVCSNYFLGIKQRHFCSIKCCKENGKRKYLKKYSNKICSLCNNDKNLDFHHIQMQKHHGIQTIPLCENCHILIHKFYSILEQKGYVVKKESL